MIKISQAEKALKIMYLSAITGRVITEEEYDEIIKKNECKTPEIEGIKEEV